MIKITEQQLKDLNACQNGIDWFIKNGESSLKPLIGDLLKDNKPQYAVWLLPRLMTHPQQIKWAIYSAEQVIKIFEKKYPEDLRPRKAIKAAKDFLAGKITAYAAADAAHAAADAAAYAAYAAAYTVADAAYAAYAAYAAADAAADAAYAAYAAYAAADAAADAAKKKLNKKIMNYALKLLGE